VRGLVQVDCAGRTNSHEGCGLKVSSRSPAGFFFWIFFLILHPCAKAGGAVSIFFQNFLVGCLEFVIMSS
jgi:hypothetical protein